MSTREGEDSEEGRTATRNIVDEGKDDDEDGGADEEGEEVENIDGEGVEGEEEEEDMMIIDDYCARFVGTRARYHYRIGICC